MLALDEAIHQAEPMQASVRVVMGGQPPVELMRHGTALLPSRRRSDGHLFGLGWVTLSVGPFGPGH